MILIRKRGEFVLTWVVFGVNLLRPVAVEGDSVLCCSTGTTVEQRFICGVSIKGLCTDKSQKKKKEKKYLKKIKTEEKSENARNSDNPETDMKTSLISFRVRKAVSCRGEVGGERRKKGRTLANALLICCSVWHPMSCTARGYTHLQSSTSRRKTNRSRVPASESRTKENNGFKKKEEKKKARKRGVAVGSEIEKQRGDGRDKKLGVNYSFRVDKEAYLSHTFAWWVGLHPGNRLSSSAQCWPYTEIRKRHGGSEGWTFVEEKKREKYKCG